MADCLNGNTHGPIHIQVGGGWDTSNRLEDTNVSFLKVNRLFVLVYYSLPYYRILVCCRVFLVYYILNYFGVTVLHDAQRIVKSLTVQ
jgi:hypothetical protein